MSGLACKGFFEFSLGNHGPPPRLLRGRAVRSSPPPYPSRLDSAQAAARPAALRQPEVKDLSGEVQVSIVAESPRRRHWFSASGGGPARRRATARRGYPRASFLQFFEEVLAEFGYFGRHDILAVRLPRIARIVVLVILLRPVEG